jgi:hypothetical protein
MIELVISPPNVCCLVVYPESIQYYEGEGITYYVQEGFSSLTEYTTKQAAAEAALAIDPSYNGNIILGELTLNPINVSPPEETAFFGSDVTLSCEYECTDSTATVAYQWYLNGSEIPGTGGSTLELSNVSTVYSGNYACYVSATTSFNQTGEASATFALTTAPAPTPSGVINTGRSGAGPLDLAPSYFPSLSNLPAGVTEADLELYIPGTDTVIPYNDSLPEPFKFDSMGNCYNPGDYRTVIRVAATNEVLATVYPTEGANKNILWFYNPVVPAAPAGSSVAIGE